MDITAYIRELLFGHDCVIVPAFGGFIGNYTPAIIDKNSGTFYPPVKQISFNRNLNHNDGLLVGRISESLKINYGDARSMVEEFVGDIRAKLEKGEKIVFDNIGSFVLNVEGNVQFEPDKTSNYHLDSYGLESFQCLPLEGYDVRKRVSRHLEKDPVKRANIKRILWRAAIIVPLLSVLVAVPLKTDLFKSKIESTTMNPLVAAEFENNKIAVDKVSEDESVSKNDNPTATSPEPPASEAIEASSIEPSVVEPSNNRNNFYFLITGSFKSEENAISQVNMLKDEGFNPEIVVAPNGFFRVSAMMCNSMNVALTRKDSIAEKFPGTWISRKK